MKYIVEGNNDYHNNILDAILQRRGIEKPRDFLSLDESVIESIHNYKNIEEGYQLLLKHIQNKSKIHIIIDTDTDGITSAALVYLYLKDMENHLETPIEITYHQNEGKKHGIILENKKLKLKKIDLLIVPDAGTNDKEQIEQCYEDNVDVLILDHHNLEEENALSTKAILINPQSSPDIKNKNISGVGVVYKFCKYIDSQLRVNFADRYLDLVALGNIADVIDLKEEETRYLVQKGLENIQNDFIKELIEKQSYSMDGDVNITTIGWYISPLLNATIRTGCTKEKRDMFEALIGVKRNNEYKTKGVVEIHSLQKTMARICGNVKARQDREVKASVVTINEKIKNEKLDSNKILFIDVTEMLDNSYTGLVAGKIAEQYKRPVILLQSKKDKEDSFGGSGRNYHNFTVKDLQSYLLSTGYFDKCAGHDNAFGVEIKKDKVPSCVSHINTDLRDVEIDDYYTVDYEIPMNKLTERIVKDVGSAKDIWGNGIKEPLFAITNVRVNSKDIELKGKRAKTITFNKKDITFNRKYANEDLYEDFILKQRKGIDRARDLNYTIIGKLKYKEWQGRYYPQVEIVDYNVEKENRIVF